MARGRRAGLLAVLCALRFGAFGHAQTSASLGVGASLIEYDGFLTTGAATFSPALHIDARDLSFGAQGSWTVFESGNQILQANAGAGWLAPSQSRFRFELSAAGGASKYADLATAGHVLTRSRLHLVGERQGAWLTAGAGASFDSTASAPVELGLGAWSLHERVAFVGTATAAWIDDRRHVDVTASARWTPGSAQIEARVGARGWIQHPDEAAAPTETVWGEVSALLPISRQVSLALSGGTYPADPVRQVLGADYLTAGFRIMLTGREYEAPLTVPAELSALRSRNVAGTAPDVQLEIDAAAAGYTLRVHATGARSVELMADFTDWQPHTLEPAGDDTFEIRLPLSRGVHRLNVRVDGGAWLVPAGARAEADEFGGMVGVIVVQ